MQSSSMASVAFLTTARVKDDEAKEVVNGLKQLSAHLQLPNTPCLAGACFLSAAKKETGVKLIGRLEIFPSESELATVQNSPEYKRFSDSVTGQKLHKGKETATLWQPTGGFLTRKNQASTTNAGVLVLAKFICNDKEKAVQNLVKELQTYCEWIEGNELTTYTYCVMTSQTASKEVLLFERYKDLPSVKAHGQTNEFKSMFKRISPWIETKRTEITPWSELDGSFFSSSDLEAKAKL
ncbi:hypothetical protein T069G_06247 [Trichoderma breve]|uniref:ABM domain-containing protein n=1 Tax=Trichoderma breve TaxID=2034170 RepID=A0A9W9E7T4_9HYPO|nr:hypothetical protein T069G_06247 [Trichoderma breve]KAJ4861259.1 hypothetical protein T069G_06247 [Trichoderma breve]